MQNSASQSSALDTRPDETLPRNEDALLERWLASPPARRPMSSRPPPHEALARDPLGDDVADAWFR
jgi:hypothetical protein